MASRRAPLSNVPNAINSPFRTVPALSGKRTRAQAGEQREVVHGQPPTKKQAIEATQYEDENLDPRRKNGSLVVANNKLEEPFSKRTSHAHPPTAFEKKLAAAREKKSVPVQRTERAQKHHADNLETIRQWQKHYRRQFPRFVFYLDGLPEDIRYKALRQIHSLGAREIKFFSKDVTHVITTRPIPAEQASTSPDEAKDEQVQPKTMQQSAVPQEQRRTANLLEATLQRRSQQTIASVQPSLEHWKVQGQNGDILTRARGLGIKIWALEKLNRVLATILDDDTGDETHDVRTTTTAQRIAGKQAQDADLEQLLRHEKVNGPTDRDMTVATQDMVPLRGCYIYIHDMDERTKPVMVRDYPKPASKEEGKWPQFRVSGSGRCPFIEDPAHTKKLQRQEQDAQARAQQDLIARRTRAGSALPAPAAQPLIEGDANLRRSPRKLGQVTKLALDPPSMVPPSRRQSSAEMPPFFGSTQASLRGVPRMVGGEPIASGIQRSTITSAIRSNAISSAAISSTAPGFNRRVGDTKEVSLLKRKVLASNSTIPSSRVHDMRGAINDSQDPPPRAAKRKAQETLGVVLENDAACGVARGKAAPKKVRVCPKEPKPGYCENCRDKYDDFDDHILSRKHRKFATSAENWKELDHLLSRLRRIHKTTV